MTQPKSRRPKPETRSPEEQAALEARYEELFEALDRIRAEADMRDAAAEARNGGAWSAFR